MHVRFMSIGCARFVGKWSLVTARCDEVYINARWKFGALLVAQAMGWLPECRRVAWASRQLGRTRIQEMRRANMCGWVQPRGGVAVVQSGGVAVGKVLYVYATLRPD